MKKIFFFVALLTCTLINADSVNSPLKNPSMAVTGTPREATPIVTTVIQTALPGQSCNSNVDMTALSPDHSVELVCYNNVWVIVGSVAR